MVCSKAFEINNIKMDDNALRQLPTFKYLGSIFTEDRKNKEDIIQRIKEAKVMFNNKKQLLFSNNLSFELKNKPIQSCIWSVALYGSETWTVGKNEERVINAFETGCWRRMLKIKLIDGITNDEDFSKGERRKITFILLLLLDHLCSYRLRGSVAACLGSGVCVVCCAE
jgi:hypothetical protein